MRFVVVCAILVFRLFSPLWVEAQDALLSITAGKPKSVFLPMTKRAVTPAELAGAIETDDQSVLNLPADDFIVAMRHLHPDLQFGDKRRETAEYIRNLGSETFDRKAMLWSRVIKTGEELSVGYFNRYPRTGEKCFFDRSTGRCIFGASCGNLVREPEAPMLGRADLPEAKKTRTPVPAPVPGTARVETIQPPPVVTQPPPVAVPSSTVSPPCASSAPPVQHSGGRYEWTGPPDCRWVWQSTQPQVVEQPPVYEGWRQLGEARPSFAFMPGVDYSKAYADCHAGTTCGQLWATGRALIYGAAIVGGAALLPGAGAARATATAVSGASAGPVNPAPSPPPPRLGGPVNPAPAP